MKTWSWRVGWMAAWMVVMLLLGSGCEKTTTTKALDVTPEASTMDVRGAVTLTAAIPEDERETRQLYYPLEWSVSDASLGYLRDTAGDVAVYVAGDTAGVNTITVRDQSGAEGIASVTQNR